MKIIFKSETVSSYNFLFFLPDHIIYFCRGSKLHNHNPGQATQSTNEIEITAVKKRNVCDKSRGEWGRKYSKKRILATERQLRLK